MNINLFSALTASLSLGATVATGIPARAQTPPTALWTFDEGSALTAADASGSGDTATVSGDAIWVTGVVGAHAIHLNGAGKGAVEAPKPAVDTSRSFTVEGWMKPDNLNGFQTLASIDGRQVSGFFLQLRGDTGLFTFAILPTDDAATNTPTLAASSVPPQPGIWYHLAGVYDAPARTISLYVNGVLQKTVPFTTPWRAEGATAIGRGKFEGKSVDYVTGDIDDVRFYQSALSAPEISAIAQASLPAPSLQIDATNSAGRVSPMLYGLMTEEINFSYDGGLYGELLRNRAFRDDPANPVHWTAVQEGGATGGIALDDTQPLNPSQPTSLRLTVTDPGVKGRVGAANDGYWGVPLKPSTRYRASFYARAATGFSGPLTVGLESADGGTVYAEGRVGTIGTNWKQYSVELKTGGNTPEALGRFVISASSRGVVNLNLVSLFPPTYKNRPNGNRIDLMEKMAAMKPAFLRMPGGNYLEGDTVETRFDWKKTLGPVADRPGHQGPWGYRSTDGMGLLEFLEWCEDLKMEPVLAVYAGYSLKGVHIENGLALQPFVQDALDEIEYVTGDKNTKWGARRIADGHPAPFPLHYVEVGNEDWLDRSGSYDSRFTQFFDLIKAKYPSLQIIATTAVKTRIPDIIDEHYYRFPAEFERDVHHYDHYSRSGPKIFVGEWASQTVARPWEREALRGIPTPNMAAALGDAVWMTGMERNSDIVILESYAPLFVNVNPGGLQWAQNLIGYNAQTSYASPSYYAQAMFANHVGDSILRAKLEGVAQMFSSVTRDSKKGTVYVKVVNSGGAAQAVRVTVAGVASVAPTAEVTVLRSSNPSDTNTITQPTNIVPQTSEFSGASADFRYTFPAYSVTTLTLRAK
jgi:alpha-L-arabinofuranosidase